MSVILNFTDADGDPVAVLSTAIVGLCVGRFATGGATSGVVVTLIATLGGTQTVSEPYAEVHAAWEAARGEQAAEPFPLTHPDVKAHPTARGWDVHPVVTGDAL